MAPHRMVAERGGSRKKAPCPVASGTTSRLYSTPHWLMEAEAHLTLLPPLSRAQRRRIRDDAGDDRVSGSEPRWLADAWLMLRRTLEQEQQQLSAAGLVPVGIQQPARRSIFMCLQPWWTKHLPLSKTDRQSQRHRQVRRSCMLCARISNRRFAKCLNGLGSPAAGDLTVLRHAARRPAARGWR